MKVIMEDSSSGVQCLEKLLTSWLPRLLFYFTSNFS